MKYLAFLIFSTLFAHSPASLFELENFEHKEIFSDSTYVWDVLDQLEDYLYTLPLGQIEGEVSEQAYLIHPELISIGRGSIVEPGAYIEGPCVLGKDCTVRSGAYIRGNFLAGDYCLIGHSTEVKNSIFLNCTCAGHFNYVGDSVLGSHVDLGAGFKCANLRLDGKTIIIDGIDTGRTKVGAFIGDGVHTGCNGVANPGTIMEKNSHSYPCASIN